MPRHFVPAILAALLLLGCVQETREQVFVEKTAIMSVPEISCLPGASEHAYVQFVYQENGILQYVNTKTGCRDAGGIDGRTLMGEQISILFFEKRPVQVRRESGVIYGAETGLKATTELKKEINILEPLFALPQSLHPDLAIQECRQISHDQEHDKCLSIQAALSGDAGICSELRSAPRQELCRGWLVQLGSV
jgi:hypothetical protein